VVDNYSGYARDPEPQPGDGPEYHTDHAFWLERNPAYKKCCKHCNHTEPLINEHNVPCHDCANDAYDAYHAKEIELMNGMTGAVVTGSSITTGTGTVINSESMTGPLVPHDAVNHPSHYTGPCPVLNALM